MLSAIELQALRRVFGVLGYAEAKNLLVVCQELFPSSIGNSSDPIFSSRMTTLRGKFLGQKGKIKRVLEDFYRAKRQYRSIPTSLILEEVAVLEAIYVRYPQYYSLQEYTKNFFDRAPKTTHRWVKAKEDG